MAFSLAFISLTAPSYPYSRSKQPFSAQSGSSQVEKNTGSSFMAVPLLASLLGVGAGYRHRGRAHTGGRGPVHRVVRRRPQAQFAVRALLLVARGTHPGNEGGPFAAKRVRPQELAVVVLLPSREPRRAQVRCRRTAARLCSS